MDSVSPLRYPGGKQLLAPSLALLIQSNDAEGGSYAEPYAGGAGAALSLLFSEYVNMLFLNDADRCIACMWNCILSKTEEFSRKIVDTKISIAQWRAQKRIYSNHQDYDDLEVGFATFFLNRTNRSGIIKNAGPVGGFSQSGAWKLDARYNKINLLNRIAKIAEYRDRIVFENLDAMAFLNKIQDKMERGFVFLDPPYYVKGRELYLNHYSSDDHAVLANYLSSKMSKRWVLSYDTSSAIKKLYRGFRQISFGFAYTATRRKIGQELLILGADVNCPTNLRRTLLELAR